MGCKAGKRWYTDGKLEIQCYPGEEPDGFNLGRLPFSTEAKVKMSISQKEVQSRPDIKLNNSIKHKKLWETEDYRKRLLIAQHNGWTEEARKNQSNRNLGKNLSEETKRKIKNSMIIKWQDNNYRNYMSNMSKECWKREDYRENRYNSMKKNGTFNTSKEEIAMFNFLSVMYPDSAILTNYMCDRYPFKCDFYIESIDEFIELNAHWTHGPHPFDPNNEDDIKLLESWRSKQGINKNGKKNAYFVAEEVWTIRDPEKLRVAKENNLNYVMIYKEGAIFI